MTSLLPDPAKTVRTDLNGIISYLDGQKGAIACSVVARTAPKLLVKSRINHDLLAADLYPRGVERIALRNIMLGVNYEAAVNRARTAEIVANHQSAASAEYFDARFLWQDKNGIGHGVKVEGHPYLVTHDTGGGLYFATRPYQFPTDDPAVVSGTCAPVQMDEWRDIASGRSLDPINLADFLPVPHKSISQGLEHDLAWRTYGIDGGKDGTSGHLLQLRHGGKHLIVA